MHRVLVANRGEIACRVIRACRAEGVETVAVYSDADKNALHVEMADDARHIGGANPRDSYLKTGAILDAVQAAKADAVHPGYGFLAENATFAEAVASAGLIWIGPNAQHIRDMGDKSAARKIAQDAGVPVLPGSERVDAADSNALAQAGEKTGYPLLIKAIAGGGGIGMRLVQSPDQLVEAAEATGVLAGSAFGDSGVFLERFIANARHVEVQVFGLGDGRAVHFFERECSVQRRFQKIIEESPSPGVSDAVRADMYAAAVALTRACHYAGVGTVEFIVDDNSGEFFFLEMNTRIQVEHPVTEMVCGVDLVALQLRFAGGNLSELEQDSNSTSGHAIECRLYAENPQRMFLPSPGTLEKLEFPESAGQVRIDTGFREGDVITPNYDPMIAKVIARGDDRGMACERIAEALRDIRLEGLETNINFLLKCVEHPAFRTGKTTTDFVEQHKKDLITS
ncbi:MAG: acetyl-CoA carboxylase biotin carboxylase subunit [Pseudohongiellaceae bacterium]